ncbi:right-handed parallel beta-helix repeat-containing protein [Myxococcus landrumensis]|uniref:Right-handed parallel beta-helix repeat-containing protein n=1 Tax=Myxococcus landrumensis TaxID=2813577 RepID=A0ABX7N2U2_9BACT|nr:right-handed parallel beta-helix repeat-containing protein [Myxococcus landrumus]QSQ13040.1 right-handed parallel beta-helix repeat-containing protein [Myxococcus landrumus]
MLKSGFLGILLVLLMPTVALATDVPPNTYIGTYAVWTAAGNPWRLQGALTIGDGGTLTLEPGVVVETANATGISLRVGGSLAVNGTAASPVSIQLQANNIEVYGNGTVVADHLTVVGGQPAFNVESNGSATFNHSRLTSGAPAFSISWDGRVDFENGVINDCKQVMWLARGEAAIRSSVIHGCTPTGTNPLISIVNSESKTTLVHNTFFDNGGVAIEASMPVANTDLALTLHDNIIMGRGYYGVRLTNVRAPVVHHNAVWGFLIANYLGVSPGAGSVNANPLLQGFAHLSENSPVRNAASDGTDMGAFPYAGHPAHPLLLEGILRSDRTLTGANVVTGDLQVPAGVSLTLAPGASVTVTNLKSGPGNSTVPVKVLIAGSLKVEGTSAAPARFERESSNSEVAELHGEASFKHAEVRGGLLIRGTASFQDSTLTLLGSYVRVQGTGSATFKDSAMMLSNSLVTEDNSTATVENFTLSGGRLEARGSSTLTAKKVTATRGGVSVSDSATATVTDSTFLEGESCLKVTGGSLTFERGSLQKCLNAVEATGGVVNVSYSLVRDNMRKAPSMAGGFHLANASASIVHNTVIHNEWGGFSVATQPQNSVEIRDNIIHANQHVGIEVVPATNISIHHNAVWGHSDNYRGNPTLGPGSLTEDPLFVSPRHVTFLETSPCRNAASDGTDMGAFPYVPVPAVSLALDTSSVTLPGNSTSRLTAKVLDAAGLELPRTVVTWTVPAEVGTIDSSGKLTAGCALGSYPGAVVATVGALSASADVTVTLGPIQSVTLTPSQVTLRIGETQQFSVTAPDACGREVPTARRWATNSPSLGSITTSGLYTASTQVMSDAMGVKVEVGGLYAHASVNIQPGPVQTVKLSPAHLTLAANSQAQVSAVALDRAGNPVPGDVSLRVVGGGGTLDASNRFNAGIVAGHFPRTLEASVEGVSATADVTVTPGPLVRFDVVPSINEVKTRATRQFTAQGFDAWGNKWTLSPTWTVTSPSLGTIDSKGLFRAGTVAGLYSGGVKATTEGISRSVDVKVLPGALSRLALTPSFTTLEPEGMQRFGVMGFDADGNAVTVSPAWSVEMWGAGSITSDGLYTAPKVAGTYSGSVRVAAEHLSLYATVYVTPGAISRLEISPTSPSVVVKGSVPFQVKAFDAYDNEVTSFSASWSVVKGGGSISAAGVFTAGTVAGTFADSVRVSVAGVAKTASITVTPGAVSRVVLSPQGPTVAAGSTVAFSAKAFDAYDNEVTSAPATWKVVNGGGSIDGAGVFTAGIAVGAFPGTVQVAVGGIVEQASISVVAAAPSRVVLTPQNPTLPAGGSVTFNVQAFDMYGNEAPAYPATWKVVNGGGTVNASGVFSAGTVAGTFLNTVQVTVGSATGTTSVTVTSTTPNPEPGEPSRVVLTPQNPTLSAGSPVTFRVQAFDAQGNEMTRQPATWRVVNGGGSIDASGVFTAGPVAGTFSNTVQVTVGGVTATTSVTVTATTPNPEPGEPSRVVLTPQNPTLPAGGSVTLRVQAFDVNGKETTRYPATWKVVNGGGSIDASGVFTAGPVAGTFSNTVQVTVGSVTGTTSVTVTSTTPNPEPECQRSSDCGGGETCNAGVCEAPPTSGGKEGGGGCSSSGAGTSVFGLLVLVLVLLALDSRKRRTAR